MRSVPNLPSLSLSFLCLRRHTTGLRTGKGQDLQRTVKAANLQRPPSCINARRPEYSPLQLTLDLDLNNDERDEHTNPAFIVVSTKVCVASSQHRSSSFL